MYEHFSVEWRTEQEKESQQHKVNNCKIICPNTH